MSKAREALAAIFDHAVACGVRAEQQEYFSTGSFAAKRYRKEAEAARDALLDAATPEPEAAPAAQAGQECGRCRQCLRDLDATDPLKYGDTDIAMPREASTFVACKHCGNKRCPHATDHRLVCTGSNDPGQEGSDYGTPLRSQQAAPSPKPSQAGPVIDTCDSGHKFAKLATHPMRDGKARCPNCMSIGLDACRAAQAGPVQGEGLKQAIRDFMWANEHSTLNGMPMSETESWLRFEQALASSEGQQPGGAK